MRVGFCFLGCDDSLPRLDAAAGRHVKTPVPQVRGLGAEGVAKRWRALLATQSRSTDRRVASRRYTLMMVRRAHPTCYLIGRPSVKYI